MTDREKFQEFIAREGKPTAFLEQQYWRVWQAALASQQPADDGWIEWGGGECPVDKDTIVEMMGKYGDVLTDRAGVYSWAYYEYGDRIIAYRVVKP